MGELTNEIRFPWEVLPVVRTTEDTVALLQRDFAYAVQYTSVLVHTKHPALQMLVNTRRGQIVPRGQCKFTDGTTFELQDLGMPQPNSPEMTVAELMAEIWEAARKSGLELEP